MKRLQGFTLIELMVVLVILALVATIAVPNFSRFLANQRATTKANEFVTALSFTRSEALKRGTPVTICASDDGSTCSGDNDWDAGWIVFNDAGGTPGTLEGGAGEAVIRVRNAFADGSEFEDSSGNAATFIAFAGDASVAGGNAFDFELEPRDCEGNLVRGITVSPTGRADVEERACP